MLRSTLIGALLTCGLALMGCAPPQAPSTAPPTAGTPGIAAPEDAEHGEAGQEHGAHTETDREFAQQLVTYHQRALDVAALADGNTTNPAMTGYAAQVRQERQAQLGELQAWLTATGGQRTGSAPEDSAAEPVPPGVPAPEFVAQLRQARGPAFEQGFKQAMGDLFDGAEQVARAELDEGSAEHMRALAERVLARHEAEVAQLNAL